MKQVTIKESYLAPADGLSRNQRGEYYLAMIEYLTEGNIPSFNSIILNTLWNLMFPRFKDARASVTNGMKGGRPRKNPPIVEPKVEVVEDTPKEEPKPVEDVKPEPKPKPKEEPKPLDEKEQAFYEGMQEHYPRVCKIKKPLTFDEYKKMLADGMQPNIITEILLAMENYPKLYEKVYYANLGIRNWYNRRNK